MNYERLLVLVCIATFAAGATLAALLLAALRGRILLALADRPPRIRARLLLALRTAPFVLGMVMTLSVALAFVRYEPRNTTEEPGAVLLSMAVWTLGLVGLAGWRLAAAAWRTAQCHRLIGRHGGRIDMAGFPLPVWRIRARFPVAAVSGVLCPRLILSSRILDECSPDELRTVLRHELAHIRRRDNLARAGLIALPDVLALMRAGNEIVRQWHEAVEEAADDDSVSADEGARLALAGTLVRVGRMATEKPPSWMPALALFDTRRGDNLEKRVRRLLEPETQADQRGSRRRAVALVFGVLVAAAGAWVATGPRPLHDLMEWAVRSLP